MTFAKSAGNFSDLKVWRMACDLAIEVGNLCDSGKVARSRVLADQMQGSSVSVPSNIAEGNDRLGNRDSPRFLIIARGSLAGLRTQLEISLGRGLISEEEHAALDGECADIGRLLSGLIKFRRGRTGTGVSS